MSVVIGTQARHRDTRSGLADRCDLESVVVDALDREARLDPVATERERNRSGRRESGRRPGDCSTVAGPTRQPIIGLYSNALGSALWDALDAEIHDSEALVRCAPVARPIDADGGSRRRRRRRLRLLGRPRTESRFLRGATGPEDGD